MYFVTKDLQDFCLAHRLGKGYNGKCKNIHGHNYSVRVTLCSQVLDNVDMVMDFGDIKKLFNTWIQEKWDHACMVSASDKTLRAFLDSEDQRRFVIPEDQNSTAEYMSCFLFDMFSELLLTSGHSDRVSLFEVKVWETKDACATYKAESHPII